MTNSDSGSELADEIAITVADAYGWSGPRPRELMPVDLAADVLERYRGTYVAAELRIAFEVALEGRGLALSWSDDQAVLWALNDSTFFDVEDGREVRFSVDGDGIELVLGTLRATRTQTLPK